MSIPSKKIALALVAILAAAGPAVSTAAGCACLPCPLAAPAECSSEPPTCCDPPDAPRPCACLHPDAPDAWPTYGDVGVPLVATFAPPPMDESLPVSAKVEAARPRGPDPPPDRVPPYLLQVVLRF